MHLTSYPKLVRSELRLDAVAVQTLTQQSSLFVRTYSSNHGNISSSRLPLSVISANTLCRSDATDGCAAVLRLRPPPPGHDPGAANDADIWTVIKPGHVREKIAIFASDEGRTNSAGESERSLTGGRERTTACTNAAASCLLRSGKAKGVWEENGSAKRRRRSGNNQLVQQDHQTWVLDTQQQDSAERGGDTAAEEEQKVSVVEMVAYLEQRVSERRPDAKPLLGLQRSSTTITLSRTPQPEAREGSEVTGEEPESVKVSDMVAKLECLRRRTEGDLSRSNSLRRTVGRVLLAAGDRSPAPGRSLSTSSVTSSVTSLTAALPGAQCTDREPISCSETLAPALTPPPSPDSPPGAAAAAAQEALTPPPAVEEAEPLPGLLFLSSAASETTTPTQPESRPESGVQSEKRRRRRKAASIQGEELGSVAAAGRRASVSQDFLEMRQRLQQLLEPQPYLSVLPHHLLLKILLLLPTQTLAALKCTCRYFRFVIDNYGVRPADSLWVSDPRYRDDPCKQCKKRYGRGDVSLCRWHHKPYCQALPYGPGYWMCCHGAHRDTPGCNVGLHDNRWVPAFHSINVPIYRRNRSDD